MADSRLSRAGYWSNAAHWTPDLPVGMHRQAGVQLVAILSTSGLHVTVVAGGRGNGTVIVLIIAALSQIALWGCRIVEHE